MKIPFITIALCLFLQASCLFSQDKNYTSITADIWGKCYLFHPNIVRSDMHIGWEKALVDFLPNLDNIQNDNDFIKVINTELLSKLNDPVTYLQLKYITKEKDGSIEFQNQSTFNLIKLPANSLLNPLLFKSVDSIARNNLNEKTLVFDLRINQSIAIDPHNTNGFQLLCGLLTKDKISLGTSLNRKHFGWNERNDIWFYEQSWEVRDNGYLYPLNKTDMQTRQMFYDIDFDSFEVIDRPVVLLINKTIFSLFSKEIIALQQNRPNTYIIYEDTGIATSDHTFTYGDMKFVLNNKLTLNNFIPGLNPDILKDSKIEDSELTSLIQKISSSKVKKQNSFNLKMQFAEYETEKQLTKEDKLMSLIKTWTIVKYFYPHMQNASVNWDNVLPEYISKVSSTKDDKEFIELILQMMSGLNDSHVSAFHPSLWDYSQLYVAPIKFDIIEGQLIITAINDSLSKEHNINVGDEILAIDGKSVQEIRDDYRQRTSSSTPQSFDNMTFTPGNFTDSNNMDMVLKIRQNRKVHEVSLKRTEFVFDYLYASNASLKSGIKKDNIGYMWMNEFQDSNTLNETLISMHDTKALILDFRNSYPTHEYWHFLELLANENTPTRNDEVPVINSPEENLHTIVKTQNILVADNSLDYINPIIILIDETCMSRPEDICISLKELPNVTFIGKPTSGVDGETTKIQIPGGGEITFTGQVIKFADGTPFQNIGIIPDIHIEPTIDGIKNGKDEILEEAIKFIKNKSPKK